MRAAAEPEDHPFNFCSFECSDSARKPPTQPQEIYLIREDGQLSSVPGVDGQQTSVPDEVQPLPIRFFPSCAAVSLEDEKLLHVCIRSKTVYGNCRMEELALCIGHFPESSEERLYVVYHMRSLPWQIVTEFFVSSNLLVGDTLPYIPANEKIREDLDTIRRLRSTWIRLLLQKAITFVVTNDALSQRHTKLKQKVCSGRITIPHT